MIGLLVKFVHGFEVEKSPLQGLSPKILSSVREQLAELQKDLLADAHELGLRDLLRSLEHNV